MVPLVELQRGLEREYGLTRAIVARLPSDTIDPTRSIASAAGNFISGLLVDNMTIGVGWGQTLQAMLSFVQPRNLPGMRVISLLGGIAMARRFNRPISPGSSPNCSRPKGSLFQRLPSLTRRKPAMPSLSTAATRSSRWPKSAMSPCCPAAASTL